MKISAKQIGFVSPQGLTYYDGMTSAEIAALNPGTDNCESLLRGVFSQLRRMVQRSGSTSVGRWNQNLDRFFTTGVLNLYIDPTNGDDDLNDGSSSGTAWKTVQRGLGALPENWTAAVIYHVAAGTFSGTQRWNLTARPGFDTAGTLGTVTILGDDTAPDLTLVTTGTGAAVVSGTGVTKIAQYTFNVGSYGATITDGSHWIKTTAASGIPSAMTPRASTSPNLVVVAFFSSALTNITVNPYRTTFTGSVTINGGEGSQALRVIGISFTGTAFSASNCVVGARHSGSTQAIFNDVTISGGYYAPSRIAITNKIVRSFSNAQFANCGVYLTGVASCSACVWSGSTQRMLNLGVQPSSSLTNVTSAPGHLALPPSDCDFEGTGDGIWIFNGSSIGGPGNSGTGMTFDITGKALNMQYGSKWICAGGSYDLTGKQGLPSLIGTGSLLHRNARISIANSVNAGQEVTVGGNAVAAWTAASSYAGDFTTYSA